MTQPAIRLSEPIGSAEQPLVVLGHSLGAGSMLWEKVVPALAAQYRVSLLTLPGHEGTPVSPEPFTLAELADAVADAGQRLAGGAFFYAGVSIGGALGLELALHHPEAILGAAIVASGARLGDDAHWATRIASVRESTPAGLLEASKQSWFAPSSMANDPDLTGRLLDLLRAITTEGYVQCAEALASYDVRPRLGEISVPILALYGEFDGIAPEEKQDEIVVGVQRGRKQRIDGAGHQVPAEQPEATAAALLEFFSEASR